MAERAEAIVAGNHEHAVAGRLDLQLVQPLRARGGGVDARAPGQRRTAIGWPRCRWCARSATPRWCTPRPPSRRSGTTSSPPRTASQRLRRLRDALVLRGPLARAGRSGRWARRDPTTWRGAGLGAQLERRPALHRQRRQRRPAARPRSARGVRHLGRGGAARSSSGVSPTTSTPARRKIVEAGLPAFLADRLAAGA